MEWKVGDLVARYSYDCDIIFRIKAIHKDKAELAGEELRLAADAPLDDLKKVDDEERRQFEKHVREKEEYSYRLFRQEARLMKERSEHEATEGYKEKASYFEMRGRVLHLDGDPYYLSKCTALYERLGIPVYGVHIPEKEMPEQVASLLHMVRPDILVITGHDAFIPSRGAENDVKAYRHSKVFGQTVREARKVVPQLDQLVIFSGACQSYFEWLVKAGSNFASSPERVNIHALDPVYIAAKVSLTPFMDRISVLQLIRHTLTGPKGLGGLETRGVLRKGLPWKETHSFPTEVDD
ncbi:spore coat assemly protein [Alteribacillus persepolensis]|uniref:Spore coat assemly protein n=1 Tax=Alteribacillus persepolensis TaxID=568899 RepID=A0A1G8HYR8_9BACI|nr:sporulation peptidase YabG [Alteribacillus persepolensis]SDI11757.1 spore coat assemly protein [Alteribacillus persepolensis]